MTFRIRGLDPEQFTSFTGLTEQALHALHARRVVANSRPAYPDRVELRDAEPGEALLLLNYEHQPASSPYRAAHAIYVLEHATKAYDRVDEIPLVLRSRVISLRAFDDSGMIVDAALSPGAELARPIEQLLGLPNVAYLHLHYAKFGCYACRVDRA